MTAGKCDAYEVKLYLLNHLKFAILQLHLSEIRSMFPTAGSESISCAAILGMLPLIILYCCMQKNMSSKAYPPEVSKNNIGRCP